MDKIIYEQFQNSAATVKGLKYLFGPRVSAIKINGEPNTFFNEPQKSMKFCEAVNYSFKVPIIMRDNILDCPGARRALGLDKDSDKLAKTISQNADMPYSYIRKLVDDIPVISPQVNNILMGIPGEFGENTIPDVYIIYTRPRNIMNLIQNLTRLEIKPKIPSYNLSSICGSVFSRTYEKREITISFGCPDSREHGGVKDEEVILGVPGEIAEYLLKNIKIE